MLLRKAGARPRCLLCEKLLTPSFRLLPEEIGRVEWQYPGGLVFEAHGNYPSAVHDPLDDENARILAILCDECAQSALDRGLANYAEYSAEGKRLTRFSWEGQS
jgi:hypothetical protein